MKAACGASRQARRKQVIPAECRRDAARLTQAIGRRAGMNSEIRGAENPDALVGSVGRSRTLARKWSLMQVTRYGGTVAQSRVEQGDSTTAPVHHCVADVRRWLGPTGSLERENVVGLRRARETCLRAASCKLAVLDRRRSRDHDRSQTESRISRAPDSHVNVRWRSRCDDSFRSEPQCVREGGDGTLDGLRA